MSGKNQSQGFFFFGWSVFCDSTSYHTVTVVACNFSPICCISSAPSAVPALYSFPMLLNLSKLTGHKPLKLIRPGQPTTSPVEWTLYFRVSSTKIFPSFTSLIDLQPQPLLQPSADPIASDYSCTGFWLTSSLIQTNVSLFVTIPS